LRERRHGKSSEVEESLHEGVRIWLELIFLSRPANRGLKHAQQRVHVFGRAEVSVFVVQAVHVPQDVKPFDVVINKQGLAGVMLDAPSFSEKSSMT